MSDVNHVILIGRLTRDAELKYTASGQAVCKFSLAVNRRVKRNDQWTEEGNFFDVVLWGKSGESLKQYLSKGKQVAVEGELRQDRWEQDGQHRSKIEIQANNVQLLGGSSQTGQGSTQNAQDWKTHDKQQPNAPAQQRSSADGNSYDFIDDIPF